MSLLENHTHKKIAANRILCSMPNTPISLLLFFNNKIMSNRVSLYFQQINIPEITSKVMLVNASKVNTSKVMLKILQVSL